RATTTGENVLLSLPIIDAALGRDAIKSVICLGKICTARRYPMTLQRHWPEVAKMLVTVNPYGAPVENWHTDPLFRHRVLTEYAKIAPYKAQGFIADWPLRGRNRVESALRPAGAAGLRLGASGGGRT